MALLCGLGQVTLRLWAPLPPQSENKIGFLAAGAFLRSGGMEALTTQLGPGREGNSSPNSKQELQPYSGSSALKPNQVGETSLYGVPIVSLVIDGQERLCLAQISNTLLKNYSYNEIHNRRVALGITCVQCTPVQLEILRRAGAMPISSRRCGMITKREAERLCKSFLGEHKPPKLPENFAFDVVHECAWGSRGSFIPARYNSSRAKCIKCGYCSMYFSPNKFIFHSHRTPDAKYTQPDAANFNSWRRHLKLSDKSATDELSHAWEDVKAMFNGGTRKRTFSLQGGGGSANGGSGGQGKGGAGAGGGPGCAAEMAPGPPPHKTLRCGEDEATGPPGPPPPHPQRGLGLAAGAGGPPGPGGPGGGAGVRSYPVIPVPSKGFGLLQKLPPPLFPHPYGFPTAFGLCPKKDDPVLGAGEPKGGPGTGSGAGAAAGGGAGGPGSGHLPPGSGPGPGGGAMFWGHQPSGAAKDAAAVAAAAAAATVYPTFPMFWPAAGSLPVPPYPAAQSQAKAVAAAVAALRPNRGEPFTSARPQWLEEEGRRASEIRAGRARKDVSPAATLRGSPPGPRSRRERRRQTRRPQPDKEDNHSTADDLETRKSYPDQRSISQPSPANTDRGEDGLTLDITGTQLVEKDIENLARDELQKLLLEQMELRKKLEREFQSLKDNFQDQMKRELAYREEMVQQLQIVRDTLCNELDQERKARYAIQQKLKEAHDALHHFSCKMLTPRHCTGNCSFKPPLLP
ncbi:SKI family transcriptional corepressor 1 [Leptonychotes weddellii]|uniref:SKI family transcriptional corepressor 1 n=1 Tax=Leptonychotes weddellii TaxID=9713 RepID=A0A7F8RN50_LEPWE|nr:SKI family transcriptional corepressor 1 [Leptonychotes weddellii]